MMNGGRLDFRSQAARLSLGAALLLSSAHTAESASGDFAPLAVGNTWVYAIREEGSGFWWNPTVGHRVRRTLRVDSRAEGPGGEFFHVLSFRDSLYLRKRTPDSGSTASPALPDTVRTGRFQVTESGGDGRLSLHSLGDPIPPGMEVYFRRRFRSGDTAVAAGGDGLFVVVLPAVYNSNVVDSAVYARDLGLLHLHRQHRWWEGPHRPGRVISDCTLESFNGRPVAPTGSLGAVPPLSRAEGFSGLQTGRRWRYRGLRQWVPGEDWSAGSHVRRDSIVRDLVVTGVTDSGGGSVFKLSLKDSLYHRSQDGQPLPDILEKGTIAVTRIPGNPVLAVSMEVSPEARTEIPILFNRQSFAEGGLDLRTFEGRPLRVLEYRLGYPGLMEDTLTQVEGIGVIRRSKTVWGYLPRLSDRIDWRLIELDGKPFEAAPVAVRRDPRSPRMRASPAIGREWWRLRNLLGRIRGA